MNEQANPSTDDVSANRAGGNDAKSPEQNGRSFWDRHGATIGFWVLVVYLVLLAIGAIGELFEVNAILTFPLYR